MAKQPTGYPRHTLFCIVAYTQRCKGSSTDLAQVYTEASKCFGPLRCKELVLVRLQLLLPRVPVDGPVRHRPAHLLGAAAAGVADLGKFQRHWSPRFHHHLCLQTRQSQRGAPPPWLKLDSNKTIT